MNKKILLLSPTCVTGGGTIYALGLAKEFNLKGYSIFFIGPNNGPLFYEIIMYCKSSINLNLQRISMLDLFKIFLFIKNKKIDVIHSSGKVPAIYVRLLCLIFRHLRFVHSFHGFHFEHFPKLTGKIYLFQEKLFLKSNVNLCFSSTSEQKKYIKYVGNPKNYTRIENTVFRDEIVKSKVEKESFDLVYLGRITRHKGVDFLVSAMEILLEHHKLNISLAIVGDVNEIESPQKDDLAFAQALKHRISKSIGRNKIKVYKMTQKVEQFFINSDALVLASRAEGMPLSVLEAMMFETCIIGSNVEGIKDLVRHGESGLLFKQNDMGDFIEKICMLYHDNVLRAELRKNAKSDFNKNYSKKIFLKKMEVLYNE